MTPPPLYDVNIDFTDASHEWRKNKIKLRHGAFCYRYIPPDKTVKRELFGVLVPGTDLYVVPGVFLPTPPSSTPAAATPLKEDPPASFCFCTAAFNIALAWFSFIFCLNQR